MMCDTSGIGCISRGAGRGLLNGRSELGIDVRSRHGIENRSVSFAGNPRPPFAVAKPHSTTPRVGHQMFNPLGGIILDKEADIRKAHHIVGEQPTVTDKHAQAGVGCHGGFGQEKAALLCLVFGIAQDGFEFLIMIGRMGNADGGGEWIVIVATGVVMLSNKGHGLHRGYTEDKRQHEARQPASQIGGGLVCCRGHDRLLWLCFLLLGTHATT
mmetsp:Transcript_30075/g.82594  ORF Transcript_30075/g.82594 Transcript_30075/m.82594 type:complete len:213 (-) Transcript_30075:26-664(-)